MCHRGKRGKKEKVKYYDDVSEVISQAGSDEFVVLLGMTVEMQMDMREFMDGLEMDKEMLKGVGCWSWLMQVHWWWEHFVYIFIRKVD